eukprot:EG_transcript_40113
MEESVTRVASIRPSSEEIGKSGKREDSGGRGRGRISPGHKPPITVGVMRASPACAWEGHGAPPAGCRTHWVGILRSPNLLEMLPLLAGKKTEEGGSGVCNDNAREGIGQRTT